MESKSWSYRGIILGIWWAVLSWLPYFTGYWGKIHFLFSLPLMFGFTLAYIIPCQLNFVSREIVAFFLSVPIGILLGSICSLIINKLDKFQVGK